MGALIFFNEMHGKFAKTLGTGLRETVIDRLMEQAFDSFDGNADLRSKAAPPVACREGCTACCMLRVTATAPEILLMERCIRGVAEPLKRVGVDLIDRIADANRVSRGLDDVGRAALRKRCPFLVRGSCVIYPARPLACRGHASYDRRACAAALSGKDVDVPVSAAHATVRSIVQNAMQSALRDFGYAWGSYELIHGLDIALENEGCAAAWLAGKDVLTPASANEVGLDEMANAFDAIKASAQD